MPATSTSNLMPLDFTNTEIAFSSKSDEELKKAAFLFSTMNKNWLVQVGSKLGLAAIKLRLPFVETIVKNTIFEQFCGGTTLRESQPTIKSLFDFDVQTILDYGAEAKETEHDFNLTMNENIRAIDFAAVNASVPVISTKVTGLARFALLEKIQRATTLEGSDISEYRAVLKRLDAICNRASERGVGVFIDAEETWIQDTIDHLVNHMMKRYNRGKVVVYNTFQMYRHDRLQFLIDSFNKAKEDGYMLGAKLVRGAYMEKERARAEEMNYRSPIHPTKKDTDDAFNTALRFCIDNYESIGLCNATHNAESSALLAELIEERSIDRAHPHLNFCQLYGMSDHITFNLANAGYNVAKYVPYGTVLEVVPYLIRRAQENTAVTGDMSREYQLIAQEMKRRKLD